MPRKKVETAKSEEDTRKHNFEALVRIFAKEHGIKPEEVTADLISSEVKRLQNELLASIPKNQVIAKSA